MSDTMNEKNNNKLNSTTSIPSTPQQHQQSSTSHVPSQSYQSMAYSNKTIRDNAKPFKDLIIVGLILVAIGLFIHSFGTDYARIEFERLGAVADFVGKLIIKIGMIISSIALIIFALYMEKYDITIRFGCLLVAGVIIAFEMLSFI